MSRVKATFGSVQVSGPHNRSSNKWMLSLVHSQLALYWHDNPKRAIEELAEIRAALDFIEAELNRGDE